MHTDVNSQKTNRIAKFIQKRIFPIVAFALSAAAAFADDAPWPAEAKLKEPFTSTTVATKTLPKKLQEAMASEDDLKLPTGREITPRTPSRPNSSSAPSTSMPTASTTTSSKAPNASPTAP